MHLNIYRRSEYPLEWQKIYVQILFERTEVLVGDEYVTFCEQSLLFGPPPRERERRSKEDFRSRSCQTLMRLFLLPGLMRLSAYHALEVILAGKFSSGSLAGQCFIRARAEEHRWILEHDIYTSTLIDTLRI